MRKFKITNAQKGAAFAVHIVPHARKNEVVGRTGDTIKVRLTAPPTEGKANDALVAFLAEKLDVRKSAIEIVAGLKSRDKMICVLGLTPQEVDERLLP